MDHVGEMDSTVLSRALVLSRAPRRLASFFPCQLSLLEIPGYDRLSNPALSSHLLSA